MSSLAPRACCRKDNLEVGTGTGLCQGVSDAPATEIEAPEADKPATDVARRLKAMTVARTEIL